MHTCVTGANGFVGSKLCEALLSHGDTVAGLVRAFSDLRFLEPVPQVVLHRGDLADRDSLLAAFRHAEVVFHVAAYVSDWDAATSRRASLFVSGPRTPTSRPSRRASASLWHATATASRW